MAKDYSDLAESIVACMGGKENISSLMHCMTRLRIKVYDETKVEKEKLEKLDGVMKLVLVSGQYQLVIGTHVETVFGAVENVIGKKMLSETKSQDDGKEDVQKSKNIINMFIDTVSGIFLPLMSAMTGAALVKTIPILCSTMGWLSADSSTYRFLYAMGDAFFTFLPLFLAYTAAEKFKANKFIAVIIAAAMVYPDITAMYNEGNAVTFLGIPVILISYTSSVIPPIIAVYAQSKLEKLLNKVIPKLLRGVFVPLLTLLIVIPVSFIVIGPVTSYAGTLLGDGVKILLENFPVLTALVFGTLWQVMILFGLHWGMIPVVMNNISVYGGDTLLPLCNGATFAIIGAVLAVIVKTKKQSVRDVAVPAFVTGLLGGVTEPAIYGICLKYKRPFYIACICSGISGIPMALANVMWPGVMSVSLLTAPALIGIGGVAVVANMLIAFVLSFVLTYVWGFNDKMTENEK